MKSDSKRVSAARTRGSYVSQACAFCRRRKTKCDGDKPTCGHCRISGHQCTWGSESAKRPSTKQYVESLRNRIKSLEAYSALLESKVRKCIKEHGGIGEEIPSLASNHDMDDDADGAFSSAQSDIDEEIEQLCAPTKNLILEDDDLQYYGPTSIFHLARQTPERVSRFPDIAANSHESYVLLVDGVDNTYYDPDFDWSRHLPHEVPLTRLEHDKVLDLLFKFFTSWCLRVVPALFLRDMYRALSASPSQPQSKTPHYSPMLHNALVALATAFSDDSRIRDLSSRQYFARKAKGFIETECQKPNISVVHALSILGSFHSSQGDQTLGYLYFGMSGRMSQALGLNVDCSSWVKAKLISHDDMLDRNWVHWTTFSQDVCWSLYVGRDFCVSPSDKRSIPVPFVDSEFDNISWHYPQAKIGPQPNHLSRTFAETCELLKIARRIMDVVNGLSSTSRNQQEISYELISRIDVELNTWKEKLPPEVDITLSSRSTALPHRIMLHLAFWWSFILLHRPFYHRAARTASNFDRDINHIKLCNRAAENIMELLASYRSLYTLRYVPITLIQVAFSAGTIFLLAALHATSGSRLAHVSLERSIEQSELCIQYLGEAGKSWHCANDIAKIFGGLLADELKPRLAMRSVKRPLRTETLSVTENSNSQSDSSAVASTRSSSGPSVPSPTISSPASGSHGVDTPPQEQPYHHPPPQQHSTWDTGCEYSPFSDPTVGTSVGSDLQWDDSFLDNLAAAHNDAFGMGASIDFGFNTMGLGMPVGETIPTQPYMAFDMMSAMFGSEAYQHHEQQFVPSEQDTVASQRFFSPQ